MKRQTSSRPPCRALLAAMLGGGLFAPGLALATCDVDHQVQAGDTYYSISQQYYGTRAEWQILYRANQSASGLPSLIPGNVLYIPCIGGVSPARSGLAGPEPSPPEPEIVAPRPAPKVPDPAPVAVAPTVADVTPRRVYPENAELTLLTGSDYAPFVDLDLPEQGLATELVHAALDNAPSPVTYSITWENDWSQHLFPLLDEQTYDMGFPWLRPDCEGNPDNERCKNFHFSDPLMLMPIMLFVRDDKQFAFQQDSDIAGRSICRPKGYFTHDLDGPDRRWITDGVITFVEGDSPGDCFYKVLVGEVDAATVNLFLGASVILEMGLRNQIVPLERPVSEQGLHVIISKRHWRGTTHLYRINAGLQALKADGRFDEIVSRHLEAFQSRLQ